MCGFLFGRLLCLLILVVDTSDFDTRNIHDLLTARVAVPGPHIFMRALITDFEARIHLGFPATAFLAAEVRKQIADAGGQTQEYDENIEITIVIHN
jgi:hypothetical protein